MKAADADAEQKKMKEYACEKCGKGFDQKSHYDAHMKKKNPCVSDSILEKRLEGLLQKIEPVFAGVLPQKTNDKMAEVIKTKEEQHKFFESLHNLLWNDAGLNPEKALEHMTFFFAYRLIEQQADALCLPQECRWSYLANNIKDKQHLFDEMNKGIITFRKNKKTKPFFKPHEIKKIDTLYTIVQEINKLDIVSLQETDTLGDIFEYMLARGMSTMSDEGQYFTMRAICKLAFKLSYSVKQRVRRDDGSLMTFADFFCGTGGFPAEYVKGVNMVEGKKTDWSKDCESIYCMDKNVSSVMTTLLNMLILTGIPFSDKKIREYNSFQDNISKGHNAIFKDLLVDYCFMNPPYGGDKKKGPYNFKYAVLDKDTKTKHYRVNEDIQTIGIEDDDKVSAGVQLAMATLAPGGVCAIVLPQGFFFGATQKVVELRKRLAEEYKIWYVVDIASGAFKNTATKTSMMVFQRGVGATEKVAFMDMDEKVLLDIGLEELRGKNYSLNYKMYFKQDMTDLDGFEMVKLGDIATITTGKNKTPDDKKGMLYPYYGTSGITGYTDHFLEDGNYILTARNGTIGNTFIINGKTYPSDHMFILKTNEKCKLTYLYYWIISNKNILINLANVTTIPGITRASLVDISIPLPSLEKQEEIVKQIDLYSQLGHTEEQSLKLLEKLVMGWVKELGRGKERVKLGDVCELKSGFAFKSSEFNTNNSDMNVLKITNINDGFVSFTNQSDKIPSNSKYNSFLVKYDDSVISLTGLTPGKIIAKYTLPFSSYLNQRVGLFCNYKENVLSDYVYYYLLQNTSYIIEIGSGTCQKNVSPKQIMDIEIPLPSLAEQQTLQSDFDEIKHKHIKIAEYKAKAQDAIYRLIPGANNNKILEASEKQQTKSESPESVDSEPSPQKEKKTRGPSKIKTRPSSKE
jgi:type I restriction enzyme S subunit